MFIFKALSQVKEQDLKVYGALRKDPQFIQQLVQLYHELQTRPDGIFTVFGIARGS